MSTFPDLATDADLFKALFETAPDAMIVVDHDGRIVLANPQADRLFGYDEGQLRGLKVEALLPEQVRSAHIVHRSTYMSSPRVRPMGAGYELTGVRRNGQSFPVEIGLSPIPVDGRPLFAASIRDISETQRARQALVRARYDAFVAEASRLLLESPNYEVAVDGMPSLIASALKTDATAILFRDAHGTDLHARAATGAPSDLLRTICAQLSQSAWMAKMLEREVGAIALSRTGEAFAQIRATLSEAGFREAGMVPLFDRYEPMGLLLVMSKEQDSFDHDKLHFLQSVANMLAAAVQRSRSEEKLSHAQRLDAIGQLTGGIAHDFNNLLTVISGNLQLLMATLSTHSSAMEIIESAARATDRCAALTGKLLSFASRRRLTPRPVHATRVLTDLKEMLGRTLGERITVVTEGPDDISPIHVDPAEFDTALVNLAVNARDAMPRGGTLTITVREEHVGPTQAGIKIPQGSYVVFSIADTGMGMTPEVQAHALEPFFTTKEVGKGSGLGLSMVYGFVKQSGGHLSIDSQLGYGTRVDLHFPVAPSASGEGSAPQERAVPPGHETILVVEDEPEVRGIALAFLHSMGYATREADNASQALEQLERHPEIALLFSDVVLGNGMTGVELAKVAQQMRPGLPVLLTSGYEHWALDTDDASLKRFNLLRKPYRMEALAAAMHDALKHRSPP
ncbi:PAS domain S-box protein [Dyella koreensis]|uniref:histidine kinase n=1 Tax=Dyella koreensis TaxID=311235 RepID=A0ABW8KC23_9GAMM